MKWNRESGESKHDFVIWLFDSNKHYIRNLLLLYISFYPLFAIFDYYNTSQSFSTIFNIRLYFGAPPLIASYACTFIPKLFGKIRTINATALLMMNLSISLMYISIDPNESGFDSFYTGLIITIATLGISMSSITLTSVFISLSAISFILISVFVHHLPSSNPFLFARSTIYILIASGLFMVIGVILERFSLKLYHAHKRLYYEKGEIIDEKEKLENLNKTKDRFFRIISHDLRSPFTSLVGYFDLLLRDDKKEFSVKKSDIQKIYLHARRTYNLLNNLLNWTKTQLNQYDFKPYQHNLQDIFSDNKSLYREIANQKEISIIHTFPKNAKVFCDKEMIATIVRNLIFNAIKYTKPNGEINLVANPTDDNKIEIAVIDNGIGISKENIDKILNTNVHYTSRGTFNEEGAGIGLIICHDLLKRHNTRLQIESLKNSGSKFYFVLPIYKENSYDIENNTTR